MSYSLWVSGARIFVPTFYRQLFENGDVAAAMLAGRKSMFDSNMRDTYYGQTAFHDWIVPVLYEQGTEVILPRIERGNPHESALPLEVYRLDYRFIGRDGDIRRLEQAVRSESAGILIYGMAGEGKTTLVKSFLQWLEDTNGLAMGAFWFSFEDIHSAEYVIGTLIGTLIGTKAMVWPIGQKMINLTQILRENQFFIVWDNFESASGIPGTEVSALIEDNDDRQLLKQLLHGLYGGKTKVLITSRSRENWLTPQECFRMPLKGLEGEELWQYCNTVVADLGLTINRKDKTYKKLLDKLEGNPLAVRAILLRLTECSAAALLTDLEEDFNGIEGDNSTIRIQAALTVLERGLNPAFEPILRLLGLHEYFVNVKFIDVMLKVLGLSVSVTECLVAMESAGLCHSMGSNIYRVHPALRACLTRLRPAAEADKRAFVEVIAENSANEPTATLFSSGVITALYSVHQNAGLWMKKPPPLYAVSISCVSTV